MELDHFSHEHPLKLIHEVQKDDDSEEKLQCDGCRQQILGSAYNCNECKYILHEKCAKLPKEINHPMHLEHTLTLHSSPPNKGKECTCAICKIEEWKWFTYHCSHCELNVHISCALQHDDVINNHEVHHHPLTFVPRPSLFFCDACRIEAKSLKEPTDFSYRCTTCPFWIHKTCATSPSTIKYSEHEHELDLAHSLPEIQRKYENYCSFCGEKVYSMGWIYYCAPCRYFLHLKCATGQRILSGSRSDESYVLPNTSGSEACLDPDLMKFPLPDNSMDLISKLVESFRRRDNVIARELSHPAHDKHPLLLSDVQSDIEVLCNGCRLPISIPFYRCEQCNDFFLHKCCAHLPEQIQHPSHQGHPLYLFNNPIFLPFKKCNGCQRYPNGFFFMCSTCRLFCLDVQCASQPKGINHDSHNHSLKKAESCSSKCYACGERHCGRQYKCETCGFNICSHCASLPRTFKHEWDHHQLALSYPPFYWHPEEFICEICEEFIDAHYWLYHCRQCDQSFHTKCIKPRRFDDQFPNVKFGVTGKVDLHEHPLVLVRKSMNKSPSGCENCGTRDPQESWAALKCVSCNYQLRPHTLLFEYALLQLGYKLPDINI